MSVAVYLANSSMQIVVGESKKVPTIQKLYNLEMEEGIMLNGVVISEYGLINLLKSTWERFNLSKKDIELTVSGAQFISKTATIPRMKEKKAMEVIRREFTDIENQEQYIFDYAILEENKKSGMMTVVAVAATREIVESYVDVFEKAGITVGKLRDALGCQIKAFELVKSKVPNNYIVLNLDGTNLTSTLFVDHKYNYFNRTRIFSEKSSDDFGVEIARTVSSILQFHSTSGDEEGITTVYMGGFQNKEFETCREQIELLGMKVQSILLNDVCMIPSEENRYIQVESSYEDLTFCNYSHLIGELAQVSKDIDLIDKMDEKNTGEAEPSKLKPFIPLIMLFGIGVVLTAGLFGWNQITKNQIENANEYINNTDNIEQSQQADQLEAIQTDIMNQTSGCNTATEILNSYPKPNSKVLEQVVASAGSKVNITLESYDAATGAYVFIARAPVVTDIYNFISDLNGTEMFADLEYSGYGYTEDTKQYDIHVSGYLNENAGK